MHYIKGTNLTVPDTLSRALSKDCVPEISEEELKCYIHTITTDLISDEKLQLLKQETVRDHTIQALYTWTIPHES